MREFYRVTTEHIQAVQVTDSTFDAPHPNPEHVIGVTYRPRERVVIVPVDEYGETVAAKVGDWIVRDEGSETFRVVTDEDFRLGEWLPNPPALAAREPKETP